MASTQVETVSTAADKAKLVLAAALVVGALVGFYLMASQGPIVQWVVLIAGLAAAVIAFGVSEPGKQLVAFGRDAWREVKKWCGPPAKRLFR